MRDDQARRPDELQELHLSSGVHIGLLPALTGPEEPVGGAAAGPMRIALIGTRGVPASYGGFETAVEEIGQRLVARGHDVTVYCRGAADESLEEYLGMHLVHLPAVRSKSLETLSHTALSTAHLFTHGAPDVAVVFNGANSPFLPALRAQGIPVATHMDGLEWKRAKWNGLGRRYYRMAESLAVRWSDALIADAPGIADYYRDEFGTDTDLIAYGAPILRGAGSDKLAPLGLTPGGYHLVVARFEPENHVDLAVMGALSSAAAKPLVVVGSAPYADAYTARIQELARDSDRVRLLGGVWDQEQLDQLYAHAVTYVHGHSVGGTNPSLLRAMGAGTAVLAYDVNFNRDVLGADGRYFSTPADLAAALLDAESDPADLQGRATRLQERAEAVYRWDDVTDRYEAMCARLVRSGPSTSRPSGRRSRSTGPAVTASRTAGTTTSTTRSTTPARALAGHR